MRKRGIGGQGNVFSHPNQPPNPQWANLRSRLCSLFLLRTSFNVVKDSKDIKPRSVPPAAKPPVPVIVTDIPKKRGRSLRHQPAQKKTEQEPKNIFSDATTLYLLRLLKGKHYRSETLPERIALPSQAEPPSHPLLSPDLLQEELAAALREKITPWLWSFFVHLVLLLVLALFFLPNVPTYPFEILGGIGDDFFDVPKEFDLGLNLKEDEPLVIVPQHLPVVEVPLAAPPKTETDDGTAAGAVEEAPPGLSFGSRVGSRAESLSSGGGTGKTDESVLAGLRWLVSVQNPDGGWRLGTMRNPVPQDRENRNAATAMALLAFQGYGILPNSPQPEFRRFAQALRRGWDFLLRQQHTDGCFFRDEGIARTAYYEHRFYTHALCTIALCELLAMTGDEQLREPANEAILYCIKHQSVSGGWRYRPDRFSTESDLSVTGWVLIALKTGQAAGIEVPPDCYTKISMFLDTLARHDGTQYLYRTEEPEIRLSMIAEGLFCREMLGWKQKDERLERGLALLVQPDNLPSFDRHYKRDVYGWYYAAQALHHHGGEPWKKWNGVMRELLPEHQEKTGINAGSWNPDEPTADTWGRHYGRLYTTCLSILILETYYRHERIYP